jgi:cyclopropane-fatty-acyl-phospholipid synthase
VVSIEMLEQVGDAYLPAYFAQVARRLRPGGRAVIQSIVVPDHRHAGYRRGVDWMQTYIFPGTHIPSRASIRAALAGTWAKWVISPQRSCGRVPWPYRKR